MSASPAAGGWVPPVRPWPYLVGEPVCLLKAPVPAFALIVAVAEELRRVRLRVRVAPDGRSVQARPTLMALSESPQGCLVRLPTRVRVSG